MSLFVEWDRFNEPGYWIDKLNNSGEIDYSKSRKCSDLQEAIKWGKKNGYYRVVPDFCPERTIIL